MFSRYSPPTLLSPLPPDAPGRPGGLPPGYVPRFWRHPGVTPAGDPTDLVMASIRFPGGRSESEWGPQVCGPAFANGDVPAGVNWTDEQLVTAFLSWIDLRGFVPQEDEEMTPPSPFEMLAARRPFLKDVGGFGVFALWASDTRSDMLRSGKVFVYSEQEAWEVFLREGRPGVRAYFATAHFKADRSAPSAPVSDSLPADDGGNGGTSMFLAPTPEAPGGQTAERVRFVV